MKNFIVASVLGKTKQPGDMEHQVGNRNRAGKATVMTQQPVRAGGRRMDNAVHQMTAKERPRGKSCDRMMQNRSESRQYSEWNDDGGFGQWRAIHHNPSAPLRPEAYYHHHHARPVSITDRIQLVLTPDKQPKQQQQQNNHQHFDNNVPPVANHRFQQPFTSQYYPEYLSHPSVGNGAMTTGNWAYQSGSSSEETAGPQSLDSQWAVQRQQQNHRINHPSYPAGTSTLMTQPSSSALSRKLSTYGTLPKNRQRFFMAKYQSK